MSLGGDALEAIGGIVAIEHDPEKWEPVFGIDHAPPMESLSGVCWRLIDRQPLIDVSSER